MRDIHRDHEVCALLFQTQQHEMNVDILWHLAVRVRIRWWCLDEAQRVDWLVAAQSLVAELGTKMTSG